VALIRCPERFDGDFAGFYCGFVEPNLPALERVKAFDAFLSIYLSSDRPVHIVRQVRGQERGALYMTARGDVLMPSDNAPGWWLHAFLLGEQPIEGASAQFFAEVPTHMFGIVGSETLNSAGYHLAHIVPVKNRDLDWTNWTRAELQRRFLLNIHPCNWFLIAKTEWHRNGARADITAWIKTAYAERYGELYQTFVRRVGNSDQAPDLRPGSPDYKFHPKAGGEGIQHRRAPRRRASGDGSDSSPHIRSLNRPGVVRELVGKGVILNITTVGKRFVVPHDELLDWVKANTNVPNTRSWLHAGNYNWPRPTQALLTFLRRFEVSSMEAP
jgi:hypothetical protein